MEKCPARPEETLSSPRRGGTLSDRSCCSRRARRCGCARRAAASRIRPVRPSRARCGLRSSRTAARRRRGPSVCVIGCLPVLGVLELDRDTTVRDHRAGGAALDEPVLARRSLARLRHGRGEVRLHDARPLRRPGQWRSCRKCRPARSSSPTSRTRASPRRERSRSPFPDRASGIRSSPDLRRRRAGTSSPGPRGAC